jgi:hypothetical protein
VDGRKAAASRRTPQRFVVNHNWTPSSLFFVNVASKGFRLAVSGLESTLAGCLTGVDSKRLRGNPLGTTGKIWRGAELPRS